MFETLKETVYINTTEPPLPTQFIKNMNTYGTIQYEEDPEYVSKSHQCKMLTSIFATDHREWKDNAKHQKANKSRIFENPDSTLS